MLVHYSNIIAQMLKCNASLVCTHGLQVALKTACLACERSFYSCWDGYSQTRPRHTQLTSDFKSLTTKGKLHIVYPYKVVNKFTQ